MYKLLVIAHREYSAMVATKAFLITLIMMPIMMFGGMFLMPRLSALGGGKTQKIIIADGTGELFPSLKAAADARNAFVREATEDPSKKKDAAKEKGFPEKQDYFELVLADTPSFDSAKRLELSDEIRKGSLYAFVEIPSNVLKVPTSQENSSNAGLQLADVAAASPEEGTPMFVSQDALLSSGRMWLSSVVGELVRSKRLVQIGLDPVAVSKASQPVELKPISPFRPSDDKKDPSKLEATNVLMTLFLPFGIMMLMFMVIFLAAQPMLESGMEEKSHRIAEVLLGSVNSTELMAGKLLGNVAGSLVIFAIYGIGGWLVLDSNGWAKELPWTLIPWFICFQLLGVLFFSSIFLTVGASISELKEAQSLLMPIWLVLVAPMMVWLVALRDPNGPIATSLSFFPPTAPLMMILRLASGQTIPWWQPPLAALVLVIATIGVVYFAGRIYKASLLRNDSARTFRQLLARLTRSAG